jgi:hypothetical protein
MAESDTTAEQGAATAPEAEAARRVSSAKIPASEGAAGGGERQAAAPAQAELEKVSPGGLSEQEKAVEDRAETESQKLAEARGSSGRAARHGRRVRSGPDRVAATKGVLEPTLMERFAVTRTAADDADPAARSWSAGWPYPPTSTAGPALRPANRPT